MRKPSLSALGAFIVLGSLLCACSPKLNWREYRSADGQYQVLFPAKPEQMTRDINLDGIAVKMTMTAAQVDDATFAVGSAEVPNADLGPAAVTAMKTALVKNIGGKVGTEKSASSQSSSGGVVRRELSTDIDAAGQGANGAALALTGRFIARDKRIYQVIVLSKQKQFSDDDVDMFLRSFRLD